MEIPLSCSSENKMATNRSSEKTIKNNPEPPITKVFNFMVSYRLS
ncbi:hypothetical protein SPAR166_1233 [Streptococcus pneumoniae GA60132]|nr:hypothetical protein SPAR166_1233 [Streptococcus pneumoniae GA60132]